MALPVEYMIHLKAFGKSILVIDMIMISIISGNGILQDRFFILVIKQTISPAAISWFLHNSSLIDHAMIEMRKMSQYLVSTIFIKISGIKDNRLVISLPVFA